MKSNRKTIVLLVLFFGGLLTMWGLERAGVRTQWEEIQRADRVLPDLIDTPEAEIRRLSIDRGDEHLVFERRDPGRWQMVEPMDVAAEPARVEALVRNLQDLRKSADAGTIAGSPESFGLAPPAATVRLFGTDDGVARRPIGPSPRSRSARPSAATATCIPPAVRASRSSTPGCSARSTCPWPTGASRC